MRAKANIITVGGQVLVDCYPMKIGYIEGFLHKDNELDTWVYSEFTTGKRVTGDYATKELAIARVEELTTTHEESCYKGLLEGKPVINTTYVDYVPQVGDVVRIVRPEHPVCWSGSMDRYIGHIGEITRVDYSHIVSGTEDASWRYEDGDFIPVTALERVFVNEPVLEAPANFSPNANDFIVEGERELPDWMIILGRKLTKLTGLQWRNDFNNVYSSPQIMCDKFTLYGEERQYRICVVNGSYTADYFNEDEVINFIAQHHTISKPAAIKVSNELVFSSSFLDFLHSVKQESRIARIILSVRELQYNGVGSLVTNVLTSSEVNYLTYRGDNGNISYLPKGKEHKVTPDGKWVRDGRQDGKAGKVMRKIFTKSALKLFKETDFEIFNNKFKARFEDGLKFDILPNISIPDFYLTDNRSDDGSLGASCMRDVDPSYFDIYTDCESLRIVTLRDKDDVLHGRALLWNVLINNEEATFIDRFYVSKDSYYDKFLEFASEKGFYHKKYYKTYDSKQSLVAPDGTEISVELKVKTRTDFDYYPYIDTFTYGKDGMLCNYDVDKYSYDNTDGTRDGDGIYDDVDGCTINPDDSVTLYDGRVTHQDNAVYCDNGNRRYNGEYILRNEAYEVGGSIWHEDDVRRLS
jgi:hypothetical protein